MSLRKVLIGRCKYYPAGILAGVFIALFSIATPSQSVCPISTVKVRSLNGIVVERSKGEKGWPNVHVDLRSSQDEQLIVTTKTSERGAFKFDSVENGAYFSEFRTGFFPTYRLVVKVRQSKTQKGGGIIVKLDPDCGKTEVSKGK